MNVLLLGATGMIGQGALRECLADPRVSRVVAIVRRASLPAAPKLREIVLADLDAIETIASDLTGLDACFFCIGVSAAGLSEADYTRQTYTLTLHVAQVLARLNPAMTFLYISGTGTDARGTSRFMWARVKGRTENALLNLPFKAAYALRPGAIQPLHGIKSRTPWYRWLYAATAPFAPFLVRRFPRFVTTTAQLGHAMIDIAIAGHATPVLENADINRIA